MIERLREIEARYDALASEMASPGLDVARLTELGRELARLEPVVNAIRAWDEVQTSLSSTSEMANDPDEEVRAMAREELTSLESRAAAAGSGAARAPGPARPERRAQRDPGGARRHRRRRGRALRRRPVPHVRPLCRRTPLAAGAALVVGERRRRLQGGDRRGHRLRRLLAAEVRERRASRPARARYRGTGPHPHLDRNRRASCPRRTRSRSTSRRRTCGSMSIGPAGPAGRA